MALNLATGQERWHASSAIWRGTLNGTTYLLEPRGPALSVTSRGGALSARMSDTGRVLRSAMVDATSPMGAAAPGPVVLANGVIYARGEGRQLALDTATGRVLWTAQVLDEVKEDGGVVVGRRSRSLYRLTSAGLASLWTAPGPMSGWDIMAQQVYVSASSKLFVLRAR